MFRSESEVSGPCLEIPLRERAFIMPDLIDDGHSRLQSMFGDWQGVTVLCACGCLMRLDKATVNRRRQMGKAVECRQCRNRRVAMEKEDLDNEFFGREEE